MKGFTYTNLRQAQRLPVQLEITYSDSKRFLAGYLCDISIGGLQFETLDAIEPGSKIKLVLPFSPPPKVDGIARWVKKERHTHRIGVQFVPLTPEQKHSIREIIQSLFWKGRDRKR